MAQSNAEVTVLHHIHTNTTNSLIHKKGLQQHISHFKSHGNLVAESNFKFLKLAFCELIIIIFYRNYSTVLWIAKEELEAEIVLPKVELLMS